MRLFLFLFCFPIKFYFTQDVRDIVRFSETQVFGSARFESMAGSFGALGSDLGSSSINPAGYGRYSSSTFGLSFQNTSILNKASFNSTVSTTKLNSFKLNNLGIVLTNDVSERNRGFVYNQFGFSYNRVQNFKDEINYSGEQYASLLDQFCSQAQGISEVDLYNYLPFSTALAYDTYAIDPDGNGGYVPRLDTNNVIHRRNITSIGGISEYNFNFSSNYMNTLYIGGNIGLRTANYKEEYVHHEKTINNPFTLDSFDYQYNLQTKGTGTNIKLGIIYLPVQNFRLGLSVHTPTFYKLTDNFSADMTAYHYDTTYTIPKIYKPVGQYKYRLQSPLKLIGSMAYIFGTHGCINIDAEVVNYNWGKLKSTTDSTYDSYNFKSENLETKAQLRTVINLRIGGELVFNSQYFIRGGIAIYPSAYDQKINPAKGIQLFTGGIGIKFKNSSLDVALKVEHRNYNYIAFENSTTEVNSFKRGLVFNYSINF